LGEAPWLHQNSEWHGDPIQRVLLSENFLRLCVFASVCDFTSREFGEKLRKCYFMICRLGPSDILLHISVFFYIFPVVLHDCSLSFVDNIMILLLCW